MSAIFDVEKKIKNLNGQHDQLVISRLDLIRKTFLLCEKCGKRSKLLHWAFVQAHSFIRPHSFFRDNYWSADKVEVCDIACPKCGRANCISGHSQKTKIIKIINESSFSKNRLLSRIFCEVHHKYRV